MTGSKSRYQLINPHIEGNEDSLNIVKASSPLSAAKKFYKELSKYIGNEMSNFYFTIQDIKSKKLTHFNVKEKKSRSDNDEGKISYKIKEIEENFPGNTEKELIEKVTKLDNDRLQKGGKHKKKRHHKEKYKIDDDSDSSSSDSSSSDDDIDYNSYYYSSPINRFVYFYMPYGIFKVDDIGYNRLFLPMFNIPTKPTFELRMDFAISI